MTERYRDFDIRYDPPPIPDRRWDWQWHHKDFDLDDNRCGESASLEAAKADIDAWHNEQSDDFNNDLGE